MSFFIGEPKFIKYELFSFVPFLVFSKYSKGKVDEFKGNMRFSTLLTILDKYSRAQSHARFLNTYNLWDRVIITSVYAPDEVYGFMVDESNRHTDSFEQLIRRITKVVYHYKDGDEYKTVSVSGAEYKNKLQLLELASIELLSKKETSAGATG